MYNVARAPILELHPGEGSMGVKPLLGLKHWSLIYLIYFIHETYRIVYQLSFFLFSFTYFLYILYNYIFSLHFIYLKLYINCLPDSALPTMFYSSIFCYFICILYYFIWLKLYLNCLPDSTLSTMFFSFKIFYLYLIILYDCLPETPLSTRFFSIFF